MPKLSIKGFTLVEIMIVVSIMAILAIIGLVVLTGLMKQGRDGKRISDVDAIYNALEVHYDPTASQYPDQIISSWFTSSTIPLDPSQVGSNRCGATGTNPCEYCLKDFGVAESECGVSDHDIATNPNLFDQRGYSICTSLEHQVNNLYYYCKHSARFKYD